MSAPLLPRFYARQERIERERRIAQIVLESGGAELPAPVARATAAGDRSRLRGIPVQCARGVTGAIPGSDPVRSLLAAEHRRERRR